MKETKVPTFKMIPKIQPINIQAHLDQLDSDLRSYVVELRDETLVSIINPLMFSHSARDGATSLVKSLQSKCNCNKVFV